MKTLKALRQSLIQIQKNNAVAAAAAAADATAAAAAAEVTLAARRAAINKNGMRLPTVQLVDRRGGHNWTLSHDWYTNTIEWVKSPLDTSWAAVYRRPAELAGVSLEEIMYREAIPQEDKDRETRLWILQEIIAELPPGTARWYDEAGYGGRVQTVLRWGYGRDAAGIPWTRQKIACDYCTSVTENGRVVYR